MAESNDPNSVTIVLKLNDDEFEGKVKKNQSVFQSLEHTMSGALNKAAFGAISFNQALELTEKVLQGIEAAMKTMSETENWKNQEVALKNLTNQLGVNTDAVVKSIKLATGGTITDIEATQTAFKLLSAGIRAESIPALVGIAENLEKASGGQQHFNDIIQAFAQSTSVGATRGLKQFGIEIDNVGNRQQIVNAIIQAGNAKVQQYGEGFDETAKKIETRSTEAWNAVKKSMGGMFNSVAFSMFATEGEKAEARLKSLHKELESVKAAAAGGQKSFMAPDATGSLQVVDAQTKQKSLLAEIQKIQGVVNEEVEKEKKEREETNAQVKQTHDLLQPLNDYQKQSAQLAAQLAGAEKVAADQREQYGAAEISTMQNVLKAKQAIIDREAEDARNAAMAKPQTEAQLTEKLVEIEENRRDRIRALRMEDAAFNQAQQDAELAYMQQHMTQVDNVSQRFQEIQIQRENEKHARELEAIRQEEVDDDQRRAKIEALEAAHQTKMYEIKHKYDSLSTENMKIGYANALSQMEKQYGSFSKFTETAVLKSHSIMSNAFVQMAKGHGNAMNEMLGQFLEMIGTMMIQSGVFMMFDAFKTFPIIGVPELQAGVGSVAAGMALVGASVAVSPPSSDTGSGGGGFSGGYVGSPTTGPTSPEQAPAEQLQRKSAQIIIQGDYLNSRETANHLAEVLRSNSDVTDYAIVAQGKNYGT